MAYSSPCKNCSKRTLHCHSACKEYLEYSEGRRIISLTRQAQNISIDYTFEAQYKIKKRINRNRKGRL